MGRNRAKLGIAFPQGRGRVGAMADEEKPPSRAGSDVGTIRSVHSVHSAHSAHSDLDTEGLGTKSSMKSITHRTAKGRRESDLMRQRLMEQMKAQQKEGGDDKASLPPPPPPPNQLAAMQQALADELAEMGVDEAEGQTIDSPSPKALPVETPQQPPADTPTDAPQSPPGKVPPEGESPEALDVQPTASVRFSAQNDEMSSDGGQDFSIDKQLASIKEEEERRRQALRAKRRKEKERQQVLEQQIEGMLATEREIRHKSTEEAKSERKKITAATLEVHKEQREQMVTERQKVFQEETKKFQEMVKKRREAMQEQHQALKERKQLQLDDDKQKSEEKRQVMKAQIDEYNKSQLKRKEKVDAAMAQFYQERKTRLDKEKQEEDELHAQQTTYHNDWSKQRMEEVKKMHDDGKAKFLTEEEKAQKAIEEKRKAHQEAKEKEEKEFREKVKKGRKEALEKIKKRKEEEAKKAEETRETIAKRMEERRKQREEEQKKKLEEDRKQWAEVEAHRQKLEVEKSKKRTEDQAKFQEQVEVDRAKLEEECKKKRDEEAKFWKEVLRKQAEMKQKAEQRHEQEVMAMVFREKLIRERVDEIRQETFWRRHEQEEWDSYRALLKETCDKQLQDRRTAEKQKEEEQAELRKLRKEEIRDRKKMELQLLKDRDAKSRAEATLRQEELQLKRKELLQDTEHKKRQTAAKIKADTELCRRVWREERRDYTINNHSVIKGTFEEDIKRRNEKHLASCNIYYAAKILSPKISPRRTVMRTDDDCVSPSELMLSSVRSPVSARDSPSLSMVPPVIPSYRDMPSTTVEKVIKQQLQRKKRYLSLGGHEAERPEAAEQADPLFTWTKHVQKRSAESSSRMQEFARLLCYAFAVSAASTIPDSTATAPQSARGLLDALDTLHFAARLMTGRIQLLEMYHSHPENRPRNRKKGENETAGDGDGNDEEKDGEGNGEEKPAEEGKKEGEETKEGEEKEAKKEGEEGGAKPEGEEEAKGEEEEGDGDDAPLADIPVATQAEAKGTRPVRWAVTWSPAISKEEPSDVYVALAGATQHARDIVIDAGDPVQLPRRISTADVTVHREALATANVTLPLVARVIARLREECKESAKKTPRVTLCGHGYGGMVASVLAALLGAHGVRVHRLVLFASPWPFTTTADGGAVPPAPASLAKVTVTSFVTQGDPFARLFHLATPHLHRSIAAFRLAAPWTPHPAERLIAAVEGYSLHPATRFLPFPGEGFHENDTLAGLPPFDPSNITREAEEHHLVSSYIYYLLSAIRLHSPHALFPKLTRPCVWPGALCALPLQPVQAAALENGVLSEGGRHALEDIYSRFCEGESGLDFTGVQAVHHFADGIWPTYILAARHPQFRITASSSCITLEHWLEEAEEWAWTRPHTLHQVVTNLGYCVEQLGDGSAVLKRAEGHPGATLTRNDADGALLEWPCTPLIYNGTLRREAGAAAAAIFACFSRTVRLESGGEIQAMAKPCFAILWDISEFAGAPPESGDEIWDILHPVVSQAPRCAVAGKWTGEGFERAFLYLAHLNELNLWRRLAVLGFSDQLRLGEAVYQGTLQDIHATRGACPCWGAPTSPSRSKSRPRSSSSRVTANTAPRSPVKHHHVLMSPHSLAMSDLPSKDRDRLMDQLRRQTASAPIPVIPRTNLSQAHFEKCLSQSAKVENSVIREKLQRVAQLESELMKRPASPKKVKETSVHLYHQSLTKEMELEDAWERCKPKTKHDEMKPKWGVSKRIYDPEKMPTRKEPTEEKKEFPPPPPEPGVQRFLDKFCNKMYHGPVEVKAKSIETLQKKYAFKPEKEVKKLSAEEAEEVVQRHHVVVVQNRQKRDKLALAKVLKEEKAATIKVSREEMAELTDRLYNKGIERQQAVISTAAQEHMVSRRPSPKVVSRTELEAISHRMKQGERPDVALPHFYD
eukprot:Sspe_Gene.40642::Locus_19644_Transcript_1_1_Confidence_1.000_Length_6626::g.40642::m.40642